MSRKGLARRYGSRQERKVPRGSGLTKPVVLSLIKKIEKHGGSLRSFAKMNGLHLEILIGAIQKQDNGLVEEIFYALYSHSRGRTANIVAACITP